MKDKDLIKAQQEWYKKLEEDGFKDIEYFDKTMEPRDMMSKEATKLALTHASKFTATEQYYIEASQFWWDHEWKDKTRDKNVWYHHSEGIPHRKIVELVNDVSYQSVRNIINKYKKLMQKQRTNKPT